MSSPVITGIRTTPPSSRHSPYTQTVTQVAIRMFPAFRGRNNHIVCPYLARRLYQRGGESWNPDMPVFSKSSLRASHATISNGNACLLSAPEQLRSNFLSLGFLGCSTEQATLYIYIYSTVGMIPHIPSMNWKYGGQMSDNNQVTYAINPTTLRPLAPDSPQAKCTFQLSWFRDIFTVTGGGFADSDNGNELHKQLSGCGALTEWTFNYFTSPDGSYEWKASGNLPQTMKAGCVERAVHKGSRYLSTELIISRDALSRSSSFVMILADRDATLAPLSEMLNEGSAWRNSIDPDYLGLDDDHESVTLNRCERQAKARE